MYKKANCNMCLFSSVCLKVVVVGGGGGGGCVASAVAIACLHGIKSLCSRTYIDLHFLKSFS